MVVITYLMDIGDYIEVVSDPRLRDGADERSLLVRDQLHRLRTGTPTVFRLSTPFSGGRLRHRPASCGLTEEA
jgi:hypothetical protein